jgi:hypothetical protein
LIVPTIALAEARFLINRARVSVTWEEITAVLDTDPRVIAYPADLAVVASMPLNLNIHDAIICATVAVLTERTGEAAQLITQDRDIRESGLVFTVW